MTDFLLELRSEEIPARMQAGARADLERLFRKELTEAGVTPGNVTVWSTPRRLALIARGLPQATEAVREETKGPRTSAPPQALEGFLRKTGLTQSELEERDGIYFAVTEKPGRAVKAVLAEAIPAIIRAFPWPKSMRWGASSISTESVRWVRPLSGILAIFGEDLVECQAGGVTSGYTTLGHRFHHPGEITIGGSDDYREKLRACHVIVDHAEREAMIREGAAKAAADAGLALVGDEGLVVENAGLTEWPVPLLGRFDPEYLEVPPEVIQLTARANQKYFSCRDGAGALANAFICTANIAATDGGAAIVDGNRKVLAARLADARFFWEQDLKTRLEDHAKKLERITFHEKLGSVADKVERIRLLANWLVNTGIIKATGTAPQDASELYNNSQDAALLCKADLVTEMVGEFPELQGLMGGYYARAEGLPDAVADAIRDHYKPVGQGDNIPTAPASVAVSLADKLDTLACFFAIQEAPTGSRDPYALRRAALAILSLIQAHAIRLPILKVFQMAVALVVKSVINRAVATDQNYALYLKKAAEISPDPNLPPEQFAQRMDQMRDALGEFEIVLKPETERVFSFVSNGGAVIRETPDILLDFFADRLKVQQKEAGVRHDLIDAVFALGGEDDLVRLLARVHALQAFIGTEDGKNLLAGYKRAANILKKEDWQGSALEPHDGEEDPFAMVDDPDMKAVLAARMEAKKVLSYTPEPAEKALIDALDSSQPKAAAAIEAEDFSGAMAAMASLRAPIDAFFEGVTVNDADPAKRDARLALLDRFRAAVHNVADFSKIEG